VQAEPVLGAGHCRKGLLWYWFDLNMLPALQVHFITAACENMVSGSATKPSDIHVSAAGKTVEVNDTDAEGRLTLADALWYAQQVAKAEVRRVTEQCQQGASLILTWQYAQQ
jgi:hypothetical protein